MSFSTYFVHSVAPYSILVLARAFSNLSLITEACGTTIMNPDSGEFDPTNMMILQVCVYFHALLQAVCICTSDGVFIFTHCFMEWVCTGSIVAWILLVKSLFIKPFHIDWIFIYRIMKSL